MLRWGLKTIDKLEAAEEKEKRDQEEKEKEEGVALGSLLASTDVPIDFGLDSLTDWELWDFSSRIPLTSQGS